LQVSGAATVSGNITSTVTIGNIFVNTSAADNPIYMQLVNTSAAGIFGITGSATAGIWSSGGVAYATAIGTTNATSFQIGTNNISRLTITSSGNVGIGTANIDASTNYTSLNINGTNGSEIYLKAANTNHGYIYANSGGFNLGSVSNIAVDFLTNSSTKMRITSGGNVLIGTTTDSGAKFRLFGTSVSANIYSDNNTYCVGLGYQGTLHGYLGGISNALQVFSTNGGSAFLNATGGWTPGSDIKRKRNFENYNLGLNAILGLKPKYYHMDFQKDTEEKQVGLVAQEVKEFIPLAYEENGDFIGLNYNAIIVTMVKAIQDQQEIINDLKQKIQ
jgi:hypothetical protein